MFTVVGIHRVEAETEEEAREEFEKIKDDEVPGNLYLDSMEHQEITECEVILDENEDGTSFA